MKHFETPNTHEDLLAITSSILTFQQKQGSLAITTKLWIYEIRDRYLLPFEAIAFLA
ncbi:hypothetical protein HCU40_16960 [Pseudanabaena biceps]|nr:hypothetical protein [Pseudanabaena biceps]